MLKKEGVFPFLLHLAALVSERPLDPRQTLFTKRGNMRSELVYSAAEKIENRFLLATLTMRAVKRLHILSTRTEDTANRVLCNVAAGAYLQVTTPQLKPVPPIDILSITPAA